MGIVFNKPTPITKHNFKNISFLLKRDDLISQDFSGNKARKIEFLLQNLPPNIDTIVSYGSIQSNAMFSLSVFAKEKGLKFRYYANHIPSLLRKNPQGNLKLALQNGMELIEGYDFNIKPNELFIKEGIAQKEAFFGIKNLAKEIVDELGNIKAQIFLPSGTGTTALFLSKALKEMGYSNLKVYTTPCVGRKEYLKEQFLELCSDEKLFPTIIDTKKRYHFGKLYKEFYQIWLELQKETKVEFDLLYDPKGWLTILENIKLFDNLIYIHQGGKLGNITMLQRYKKKFGEVI